MPIIWFTLSFFGGVITGDLLPWGIKAWFLSGILGSIFLYVLFLIKPLSLGKLTLVTRRYIFILFAAFILGGLRLCSFLPDIEDPTFILNFTDSEKKVFLTGVIQDFPDKRDQITNLRIKSESIKYSPGGDPIPVQGLFLAKIPVETQVTYGDRVVLSGYLSIPPDEEGFSYREFLKRKSIYAYLPKAEIDVIESNQANQLLQIIFGVKTRAMKLIYQLWPDPEASLLSGILLGVESGIAEPVQQAFRETGTTHIIAISGFNITIVAGLFSRTFSRILNPRKAALAAVIGIGLYTVLVGADAAVLRAAVMGGLSIFAQQIGRRQHGLNAAALASLIMVIFNPQIPWDLSFQLSLSATLGLILYADLFAQRFLLFSSRILPMETAQGITQPVSEFVLFTFAAQITTFPIMLYHFHSFSINTFLANPAILPVQPPIMLVGGLAMILGMVWFPLGKLTAPLVYPFVLYTIRIVEWFNSFPIRPFYSAEIGIGWIILMYLFLVVITFAWPLLINFSSLLKPSSAAIGLGLALILVWRGVFSAPDGLMHLYVLDIGTGSGILLQTPTGKKVLINGGPSTKNLSNQLGRILPPFNRKFDYLIITSPLEQDIDGLAENLPRFIPRQVLWLGSDSLCWEAENLMAYFENSNLSLTFAEANQILEFGDGGKITILTEDRQGGSLLVEYKEFRALFPFGLNEEGQGYYQSGRKLGEMTVLLLADSGYQSSNPFFWINNLNPQIIILSVGIKDSQGLPDRGLIDRLAGYSLLRTDQHGTIHIKTDGIKMWIQVEKLD